MSNMCKKIYRENGPECQEINNLMCDSEHSHHASGSLATSPLLSSFLSRSTHSRSAAEDAFSTSLQIFCHWGRPVPTAIGAHDCMQHVAQKTRKQAQQKLSWMHNITLGSTTQYQLNLQVVYCMQNDRKTGWSNCGAFCSKQRKSA